jgi:RNA polymerase sigma-70 factor (ECF subfamily)
MSANANAMPRPDLDARRARFADLLAAHQGLLRRLAWGFSRDPADHADLLQDMATQLWAGFAQWDGERPFSTWARRVALNVALARKRSAPPPLAGHDEAHDAPAHDGARAPDEDALLHQLRRAIDGLDALNRALLLLHLDDVGYREIGEILGLTESNVGVRLNRLKQRLRAQWEIA